MKIKLNQPMLDDKNDPIKMSPKDDTVINLDYVIKQSLYAKLKTDEALDGKKKYEISV